MSHALLIFRWRLRTLVCKAFGHVSDGRGDLLDKCRRCGVWGI